MLLIKGALDGKDGGKLAEIGRPLRGRARRPPAYCETWLIMTRLGQAVIVSKSCRP
jgi:hypothetical protein